MARGAHGADPRRGRTVDEAHFGHEHPGGPGLGLRQTAQTPDGAAGALRGRPALPATGNGRRHRGGVPAGEIVPASVRSAVPAEQVEHLGGEAQLRPAVAQHHQSRPLQDGAPAPFQELHHRPGDAPAVPRPGPQGVRPAVQAQAGRAAAAVQRRVHAVRPRHLPRPRLEPGQGDALPVGQRELDLRGVPQQRLQDAEVVVGDHVLGGRGRAGAAEHGVLGGVQVEQPLQLSAAEGEAALHRPVRLGLVAAPQEAVSGPVAPVEAGVEGRPQPLGRARPGPLQAAQGARRADLDELRTAVAVAGGERGDDAAGQLVVAEELHQHLGVHLPALVPHLRLEVLHGDAHLGQHRAVAQQARVKGAGLGDPAGGVLAARPAGGVADVFQREGHDQAASGRVAATFSAGRRARAARPSVVPRLISS